MEDKIKQADEQEAAPRRGSGAMLAAARKRQNKSIEEIADELNLSLTQIRTIELDQSEGLPEPTYVRGYIRSYANLLGLNAEEVLDHYLNKNWQKSANLDDMPRGIGDGDSSETSLFSPARVIVFVVVLGLLLFFWLSGGLSGLFGGDDSDDQASTSNTVQTPASNVSTSGANSSAGDIAASSVNQTPTVQVQAAGTEPGVAPTSSVDSSELSGDLSADASISTAPVAANAAAPTIQTTETRVVLTFSETSWVDIRDEQQNRLAYKSYPVGDTLEVAAEGVLSILVGNAKGVSMTLNGEPYNVRQHQRSNGAYARFRVGESSQ